MNIEEDISFHFIARLRHHEDELGLIIKGHLFVEFVVNQVILKRCKSPKTILNDHRAYPFSVKLQMVYSMSLLPNHIYQNIRKINRIRNELAHNLEVDNKKIDFTLCREDGKDASIKAAIKKANRRYPERYYIKMLCLITLNQLRNYFMKEYGEFPEYEPDKRE